MQLNGACLDDTSRSLYPVYGNVVNFIIYELLVSRKKNPSIILNLFIKANPHVIKYRFLFNNMTDEWRCFVLKNPKYTLEYYICWISIKTHPDQIYLKKKKITFQTTDEPESQSLIFCMWRKNPSNFNRFIAQIF